MSNLKRMGTPIFWAEGHPGTLDRSGWRLAVSGRCARPRSFTWPELTALPTVEVPARLTSVTRWSVHATWTGVRVRDLLAAVGAAPDAQFVRCWSVGRVYDTAIPRAVAELDHTLLAWGVDGEPLEEDYGGPVRLLVPARWGYKSAKSVVAVELLDRYVSGYWESRGYDDEALIEPCEVLDVNTRRRREIPGGEVIRFLDE